MDWTFGYSAEVRLGPDEGERQGRLTRVMNDWHLGPQGMFRIIDWPRLLQALRPLLEQRAEGLAPFAACLGCRWKAGVEWATVEWDGAELLTEAVKRGEGIEVELRLLTALLLGGPQAPSSHLGAFGRLLPAPIYIPPFDHV